MRTGLLRAVSRPAYALCTAPGHGICRRLDGIIAFDGLYCDIYAAHAAKEVKMKRLIWVLTTVLCVCAFTVWGYTAVSVSSGRHLYIPFLYIAVWLFMSVLAARSRSKTFFISALSYWVLVLVVTVTAAVASSGVAQTFLYKYMTAPAAVAFMPFFGLITASSVNLTPFCVALIAISATQSAFCAYFIARFCHIKPKVILISISPFAVTVACMLLNITPFADAFIGYRNGGAQSGASATQAVVSVIYILAWICVLALIAYTGASRIALGTFIFWCACFAGAVWFALSYTSAAIIASLVLSPMYGFCPKGAFPGGFAAISAAVSAVLAFASFAVFKISAVYKKGYINR